MRSSSGRRSISLTNSKSGRYAKSIIPMGKVTDLAFDATFRASAPHQLHRDKQGLAINIKEDDLRQKVRTKKVGNTILFVVDSSGSMGANQRMVATKGAILSLLMDAYKKRDKVGLVAFKHNQAELLLPPTSSVEMAEVRLKELSTGGKTPLSAGLMKGYEVLMREKSKDANIYPLLVLLTDGKANVGLDNNKSPMEEVKEIANQIKLSGIDSLVIDTEVGFINFGMAKEISESMDAKYLKIENLQSDKIVEGIRQLTINNGGYLDKH